MAALASHQPNSNLPTPEAPGIEAMEIGGQIGEASQGEHNYGIYVMQGTQHTDGSTGLIFSFNPGLLPLKDQDTQRLARNIHLSLLPLKRKEQEIKSGEGEEEVPDKDLVFGVEASASPFTIIKDGQVVEDEAEETLAEIEEHGQDEEGYTLMHSWPAIRLDYDTSLIDRASLIRAVNYVLTSQLSSPERELWMQDMSAGADIEMPLDQRDVKPGNPNRHVRNWLSKVMDEREAALQAQTADDGEHRQHSLRLSRIATSLSSLIRI